MKLEEPVNKNYAAVVVQVKSIVQLENCDNVVGIPVLGYQAIVSKDTQVGDYGIVFPAEVQLSEEFCHVNNLYRHSEKNVNPDLKGYLEDNRRVKAMKFRGHRSDALFMPLRSIEFTGANPLHLMAGDVFDKLEGVELCRKYVVKTVAGKPANNQQPKQRRTDEKLFPQHIDTDNYWRCRDSIKEGTPVVVTAKLHGTSARYANIPVQRKLSWLERVAKRCGVKVQETEYALIAGSRRTIKDPQDQDQNHFYKKDLWTDSLKELEGTIPENYIVYGELIGWVDDSPIQRNYTYNVPQGAYVLYVYRVAQVNNQGIVVDLSWDQVVEFCRDRGLLHVPEIARDEVGDALDEYIESLMDIRFFDHGLTDIPLGGDPILVDEGVCIRVEGLTPKIYKSKSPIFLGHETKLLDEGVEDAETSA